MLVHKGSSSRPPAPCRTPLTRSSRGVPGVSGRAPALADRGRAALHEDRRRHQGRHRGDDHRRAPPLPDGRERDAPVPRDQRQRLGDEEQVRQPLRLPALTRRRRSTARPTSCSPARRPSSAASATSARAPSVAEGPGRARHRHGIDPICALQASMPAYHVPPSTTSLDGPTSSSRRPATRTSSPSTTWADEAPRDRLQFGHFDNEIDIAGLGCPPRATAERIIKPQVDEWNFPDGHTIILLAEGRLLNLGYATGHPRS